MTGSHAIPTLPSAPLENGRVCGCRLLVACCLALIPGLPTAAERLPAGWKTECVGRMQISLPGEVDVAAMLPKDYLSNLAGRGDFPYKFLDGQSASWSTSGFMKITHPITSEERMRIDAGIERIWREANQNTDTDKEPPLIELLRDQKGRAWRGEKFYDAYLYVGQVSVNWAIGTKTGDMPRFAKAYQRLMTGLRSRPPFDLPGEPGICLPYLFLKDDGTPGRRVGITYRLKDHPDITVWLQDATAMVVLPNQDPDKFTAHYMGEFFWEQDYQDRRSFGSLWPEHKAFKPSTLAGYKGVKTFVELFRDDGTRDLGYLIAVRGDPEAKEDTPDLMLYVIQDSIHARQRGIEPLSQEAFFRLAEAIAASVKRRETNLK